MIAFARRERKFTLDTNLYVRGIRDAKERGAIERFHAAFAPFEYLTSVVAHELRAGVSRAGSAWLDRELFDRFERRGRVLAPSYTAWKLAGAVLADLVEQRIIGWDAVSRGFAHDVLLAVTCRQAGVTLVTDNVREFERIGRVYPFSFSPPWPVPSS